MKKVLIGLVAIILLTSYASAHGGRTDQYGGHNCSQKSIDRGLCSGYHYHNGQPFANNAKDHGDHKEHDHKHKDKSKPVVSAKA